MLVGAVYVGNAWSPSSYGHVLRIAGATQTGIIWGEPRALRSDEWSVTTPLTQASVNNGFRRFNQTSYYGEDLRINYGLPLADWGLVFKPTFWAYPWLPPAYAFSWHYFAMFGLFVFGYAHLFRLAGAAPGAAFLLSGAIYFTGTVQFFWSSNASLLAIFPWLVVVLCSSLPVWPRLLAFYWVATCWLMGNFYPPFFISFSFVALVLLIAFRPDVLKPKSLLGIGLVSAAACATVVFYLWDYLQHTISTIYPGQRTSAGGYYPKLMLLTQLWPNALFDADYRSSVTLANVVELGTVGLFWTLAALCFTDWPRWQAALVRRDRPLWVLLFGLILTLLWMIAPVPSWAGRLLLWDRVPPERMVFASGLLLVLLVLRLTTLLGLRFRWPALLVYVGAVVAGWLVFEMANGGLAGPWSFPPQLAIIPAVVMALWVTRLSRQGIAPALLWAGTLTGMVVFGRFNPLQSALPIFDQAPNPMTEVLRANVDEEGILAVQREELIGATLNGMGFRAVAHLNAVPPMTIWQQKFGDMPTATLNLFNRYAHVRLIPSQNARLLANDQVGVPVAAFRAQPVVTLLAGRPLAYQAQGGYVDAVHQDGSVLTISGWAPWNSKGGQRQLILGVAKAESGTVHLHTIFDRERWDVVAALNSPKLLLSGFTVTASLTGQLPAKSPICLYARDGDAGPLYLLANPATDQHCQVPRD
ncbi:MAG: hypothetical protein JZU64_17660 [Rhodoferax sp.]|nr:hypothetical protein [Rhodoferax sp.]